MTVVDFPIATPLTDVPGRLRKLAEQIEAGEMSGRIAIVVLVDADDETKVVGYGDIGKSVEAIGWFTRAIREI